MFLYSELAVTLVTKSDKCEAIAPNVVVVVVVVVVVIIIIIIIALEGKNKDDTSNNRSDWDHFKII